MACQFPQTLLNDPFNIGWVVTYRTGFPPTLSISQRNMSTQLEAYRSKCALLSSLFERYNIVMRETVPEFIDGYIIVQIPCVPANYRYGLVPIDIMKKVKSIIEATLGTLREYVVPRTQGVYGRSPLQFRRFAKQTLVPWKKEGF